MKSIFIQISSFLILIFFINRPSLLRGQTIPQIRFTHIDDNDGLPNSKIHDLLCDNLGFLWIATSDGLCRYESSKRLEIYQAEDPKILEGLQSSNIQVMHVDRKNNLWIGTRMGGLTRLHQPTETWKTFTHDPNNPKSISNDEILSITEDNKGRIWVGTEDGLNMFDSDTESFISFKMKKEDSTALSAKAILSIMEDDKGWLWVGTWARGLFLLLPSKSGKIEESQFRRILPSKYKDSHNVWKIYQDQSQRYWVGSHGGGLFLMQLPANANNDRERQNWEPQFYNYSSNEEDGFSLSNNYVQDIYQDDFGHLWIGTVNGLNRFELVESTETGTNYSTQPRINFTQFLFNPVDPSSISNNQIRSIFEDAQGIIWVGTYAGVSKYNWSTNQFDTRELFDYSSEAPNMQNLYVDPDGVTWVGGGEKGLLEYDFGKNELSKFAQPHKLLGDNITALFSPDDERLFIGSEEGLTILNLENSGTTQFPIPEWIKKQFDLLVIRNIFVDSQEQIWLGTEHGLLHLDQYGDYTYHVHDSENEFSLSDNFVNQVLEDSKNNLWVATYNGLSRVKNRNEKELLFERYRTESNHLNDISSNQIICLEELDSVLYIGTTEGFCGYNFYTEKFTNYSKKGNKYFTLSLEKTKDGDLWLSTIEGLSFFDVKKQTFNNFGKRDGLINLTFGHTSSSRDKNGFLYFGHNRGVTRFHPEHITKNNTPPPVYVTEVKTMSKEGAKVINTLSQQKIELASDEYYIALNFTALNYSRDEKNQYAYKLEGLEEKWNYVKSNTPATYTNLKPGKYSFRVKAANNDGIWNEEGVALTVIKKPAFWETWLFYNLCLLLIVVMVWFGIKRYTKSIEEKNALLRQRELYMESLVQKRTQELEVKNKEVRSLLNDIKVRNENLEKTVEKRTRKLSASNKDLIRSNQDLEQFAYIASHDLQEPLRVIGGFIGLLKMKYKDKLDAEAFEYIDFAVDGATRMSKLVANLLTYSKVGRKGMDFQSINLNNILKFKLLDLSKKIKERNVVIEIDSLPEIFCEKNQVSMVFYNLINNAIKFNKSDQPKVRIFATNEESDTYWTFAVQDNGIGIAPQYQQKIFEIFRRLHGKQEYEGTGIGLALCKKIINSHDGEIWMESKPGEGTTFFFTISKKIADLLLDEEQDLVQDELKQTLFN